MSQNPSKKIFLLLMLYFSQGIPHGFFFSSAPVLFREAGRSLAFIGSLGFFALPWALKFLIAPLVERYYWPALGHRRSWILPLQLVSGLCLVAMAFWKPGLPYWILFLSLFLMNLCTSTQDIASDGYAVDILEPRERGWGNGIQVGGYYLGYLFSGSLLLLLFPINDQHLGLLGLAGLLVLALLPIMLQPEATPKPKPTQRLGFGGFFQRPGIWKVLAFLILFRAGNGMVSTLSRTLMVDVGIPSTRYGFVLGMGTLASLVGAGIGAFFSHQLRRRNALILFGVLRILSIGSLFFIALQFSKSVPLFTLAFILDNMVFSMLTVAVFAYMMDWSRPQFAATDYTLQDCFGVLSILFFGILAAVIVGPLGYAATFGIAIGVALLGLLMMPFLYQEAQASTKN